MERLYHFGQQTDNAAGGIELAALLSFCAGELAKEIFIDTTEGIVVRSDGDLGYLFEQVFEQCAGKEVVRLRKDAGQRRDEIDAAADGDPVCVETMEETGYYIGIGVANAINILNPDKVVIGGGIAQAGDLLFDPIRHSVEVNALYGPLQAVEIVPAQLGDDAGVLGGAALALQAMDEL